MTCLAIYSCYEWEQSLQQMTGSQKGEQQSWALLSLIAFYFCSANLDSEISAAFKIYIFCNNTCNLDLSLK